jgi:hypothetical protein
MKFLSNSLLAFSFVASTQAFSYINVTNEFVEYMRARFVGESSSFDKVWDYRDCTVTCKGKKVYGTGTGRVNELTRWDGRGFVYDQVGDIWDPTNMTTRLGVQMSLYFRYDGVTVGKAQCYPGNFACGYEWGENHPEGTIIVDVLANDTDGYIVKVRYVVHGDDDGRPSQIIEGAMRNLEAKAVSYIQSFTRQYKKDATFVVLH